MNRTRIYIISALLTVSLFAFTYSPAYAATPKTTSSAVADAEIEREKLLTKELALSIPDQTEDPNYPITFTDPSKQGVEIIVDEKSTPKAPNPFMLPNLAIGEHEIMIKFKNKDLVVRVLTKKILVTPKAPQFEQTLKTEIVKPNSVTLRGTALPQATVLLIINSDKVHRITTTPDGKWEFIVPEPTIGLNNILAFTIKNGIVSSASKTFSVTYKESEDTKPVGNSTGETENQIISFAKKIYRNIDANRQEQPTVFYGVIAGAVLIILFLIDIKLRKRAAKNRDEKTIAALFGSLQKDGGTIVDAIQSVKEAVTGKKKKKAMAEEKKLESPAKSKESIGVVEIPLNGETVADTVADKVPPTKKEDDTTTLDEPLSAKKKAPKGKSKKKKLEPKVTVPVAEIEKPTLPSEVAETKGAETLAEAVPPTTPETEEEKEEVKISDETEEPEKKILTKEEFLKQFQNGSDKGE